MAADANGVSTVLLDAGGVLLDLDYEYLRRLIDALRVVRGNARDLALPAPESRAEAYLARRLGLDSGEELRTTLAERMTAARASWEDAASDE